MLLYDVFFTWRFGSTRSHCNPMDVKVSARGVNPWIEDTVLALGG
jgi:hypothetical protein